MDREAVRIRSADDGERRTLARSGGRRAALRGFEVDVRPVDGFLSIRTVAKPDRDGEPIGSGL